MNSIFLSIPSNIGVKISASNICEKEMMCFFQAYIPGIQKSHYISNPSIVIQHVESKDRKFLVNGNEYTIYDEWNGSNSFDVYFLLYSIIRVKLLENGYFCVHSSCINFNDKNILLVGHSGAGKSTTSLALMMKGMKMVSGNKTVLDKDLNIIAGTSIMTIRQSDESNYQSIIGEKLNYFNRVAFKLPNQNYSIGGKITDIVLVRINDGVEEFSIVPHTSALHTLFPFFIDKVNADTILCEGNDIFVGNISNELQLLNNLKSSLNTVNIYNIVGSLDFITNQIIKLG